MKWIVNILILGLVLGFKCQPRTTTLPSASASFTHISKCRHKLSASSKRALKCKHKSSATSIGSSSSPSLPTFSSSAFPSSSSSTSLPASSSSDFSNSNSNSLPTYPSASRTSPVSSHVYTSLNSASHVSASSTFYTTSYISSPSNSASMGYSINVPSASFSDIPAATSGPSGYCQTKPYGITFSPYDASGLCLSSETVYQQLLKVAKLTTNIRTYGTDCNQLPNILEALIKIKAKLGVHVNIMVGLWTRGDETRTQKEQQDLIDALKNPRYNGFIDSITSGNEDRFNGVSSDVIIGNINIVKSLLRKNNINKPVATSEAYKLFDQSLIDASDFVPVSIYPFYTSSYGNGTIQVAVEGAIKELLILKQSLPRNKQLIVSETGWPTSGSAANSFSSPSLQNQRDYLALFQCMANKHNIPTYFLEAFNASWKSGDTAEKFFGLLDQNGQLNGGHLTNLCCYQ